MYVSSHGHKEKLNNGNEIGYLVPNDGDLDNTDSMVSTNVWRDLIIRANVRHCLIIVDACKAGTLFKLDEVGGAVGGTGDTDRSVYGIVSCRGDEDSKILGDGQNSKFTYQLIRILKGIKRVGIDGIGAELRESFDNDTQRPVHGRINLAANTASNTGTFYFNPDTTAKTQSERAKALKDLLRTFNYTDERDRINPFLGADSNKQIVVLSGTEHCGLSYLSVLSRNFLEENDSQLLHVDGIKINLDGDNIAISILDLVFKGNFTTASARTEVESRLDNDHVIVFIKFIKQTLDGRELQDVGKENKEKIIKVFADFMSGIDYDGKNKFVCFVIDEFSSDLTTIYTDDNISGVNAIPVAKPTEITTDILQRWYNVNISTVPLRRLFTDPIGKNIAEIASNKYPGLTIKEMCNRAQCNNLGNSLLHPFI